MATLTDTASKLTQAQIEQWERDGFLILSGLFESKNVDAIRQYFDQVAECGKPIEHHWQPDTTTKSQEPVNILKRYPRFMMPHRVHDLSKRMLLDKRVFATLEQLLGEPAVACQSMYYFKPPGAKGQALHQDNFYLEVEPQTCIAAWTAIDEVHPDNGGLYVVPGTHKLDLQCPEPADESQSFTTHLVNAPKGMKAVPTHMQPGDVLFFNGQVIHGSGMNRSKTQWRRSFICHYMPADSRCISRYYFPILSSAGDEITYKASVGGGPCGNEFKPGTYRE